MRFPNYLRAWYRLQMTGPEGMKKDNAKSYKDKGYEGKFRPKLGKTVAATTMQIAYLGVIDS